MLSPFLALPMISSPTSDACKKLGFNPTITLVIVGKEHKIVFLPTSEPNNDRNGNLNFPAGTVVDTQVVSPVEFDYYLSDYAGLPGTSKPTYYNVFLDENSFTYVTTSHSDLVWVLDADETIRCRVWYYRPDSIQSLSSALCHVSARYTHSVSVPAPVYCKYLSLFLSDITSIGTSD